MPILHFTNLTTVAKWPTTVHFSMDLVHTPHTGYNTTILLLLIWYHLPSNVPLPNEFMYGSNVVMFSLDAGNQQDLLLLRDNFLGDEFSIIPPPGIWVPKHVGTSESWVILIYSFSRLPTVRSLLSELYKILIHFANCTLQCAIGFVFHSWATHHTITGKNIHIGN